MGTINNKIDRLYKNAKIIELNSDSKIVIMSDLHRGIGNQNDNYLPNASIVNFALKTYYKSNYTYIELGDGDELWENRDVNKIINIHNESFMLMKRFYESSRYFQIFGNHDIVKKNPNYVKKHFYNYFNDRYLEQMELFNGLKIEESILLKGNNGVELLLFHGHQGSFINDTAWRLGRFLVRYLWKPLEMWSLKDPTEASQNSKTICKLEKLFLEWSYENKVIVVTGHTHRAYFPTKSKEESYFNDGCGVSPNGITAIEIEGGDIKLVEWKKDVNNNGAIMVVKEILEESRSRLDSFTKVEDKGEI